MLSAIKTLRTRHGKAGHLVNENDPKAEDYRNWYNEWVEKYGITPEGWLDNNLKNWEDVQATDPHLVWTSHSTCEDEMVTNGAHIFKNSCCWDTFGWWIAKKPWVGDEGAFISEKASAYLPCKTCNLDGEEESVDPECLECEGEGYVNHYFD